MSVIVPILSVYIGIMITLIPFMILFLLIRKFAKKEEKANIEGRIKMLEEEIEEIKSYINMIDEL